MAWTLTLATATTVSWAGVDLVGAEVSPSGPAALSQAEVQRRIHALTGSEATSPAAGAGPSSAGTPGADPSSASGRGGSDDPDTDHQDGPAPEGAGGSVPRVPGTVAPPATVSGPAPTQRSVVTRGGTAVLSCAGDRLTVRASPARGFGLDEDAGPGGSSSMIIFADGRRASRIDATCAATTLTVRVTEGSATKDD